MAKKEEKLSGTSYTLSDRARFLKILNEGDIYEIIPEWPNDTAMELIVDALCGNITPISEGVYSPLIDILMEIGDEEIVDDPEWVHKGKWDSISEVILVERFIEALGNNDRNVTNSAYQALRWFGGMNDHDYVTDAPFVIPLIEALKGDRYNQKRIRDYAQSLLMNFEYIAIEPLIEMLEDDRVEVRTAASSLLQHFHYDAEAVKSLVKALENDNADVRTDVRTVIMNILIAIVEVPPNQREVYPLIKILESASPDVRKIVVSVLKEIGDVEAVIPLIKVLKNKNPDVRENAAEVLIEFQDSRAVKPLIKTFGIDDLDVSKAATEALGARFGVSSGCNEGTVESLVEDLYQIYSQDADSDHPFDEYPPDWHWEICMGTIDSLSEIDDVQAVRVLMDLFSELELFDESGGRWCVYPPPKVIDAATQALKNTTDVRAVRLFEKAKYSEDSNLSEVATEALNNMKPIETPIHQFYEAVSRINNEKIVVETVKTAMKNIRMMNVGDDFSSTVLNKMIENDHAAFYDVNSDANRASGSHIGKLEFVMPLIKALDYNSQFHLQTRLVRMAVEELIWIGEPAVEPLIEALDDDYVRIKLVAAIVLGGLRNVKAVKPLIKMLGIELRKGVVGAGLALTEIGEPAVEPLIKALENSDNFQVRESAAQIVGGIGDARAIKPLVKALNDEAAVRMSAVESLIRMLAKGYTEAIIEWGEAAIEPLIEALDNENPLALKALVELTKELVKTDEEKENIIKFLESDDPGMVRMGASMLKGILE